MHISNENTSESEYQSYDYYEYDEHEFVMFEGRRYIKRENWLEDPLSGQIYHKRGVTSEIVDAKERIYEIYTTNEYATLLNDKTSRWREYCKFIKKQFNKNKFVVKTRGLNSVEISLMFRNLRKSFVNH